MEKGKARKKPRRKMGNLWVKKEEPKRMAVIDKNQSIFSRGVAL